eukprot:NODE_1819_length_727_cov_191.936667_g1769_i0.p1 GENE.NODE_1819_length_727_cov_191.936667_g1769_i0~~NODE_1819_length_727_cov_191.936667_g1769_i0.p1  ORF type:complete len:181 (-),score=16.37 NODE_1819_length_727_cov_191.936667_g1769_i0:119-661(-)
MEFIHNVKALIVLDNEGARVFARYYASELQALKKQTALEEQLFKKTKRKAPSEGEVSAEPIMEISDFADICILDQYTAISRFDTDMYLYVLGSADENEVVLLSVLECFYTCLQNLVGSLDKRTVLESYEVFVLLADELIDDGIIMQINPDELLDQLTPHVSQDQTIKTMKKVYSIVKRNL